MDLHCIIHGSTCAITKQRFPISSLKRSHTSRPKLLPIIKKKSDESFTSQISDNYGWYKVTVRIYLFININKYNNYTLK